MSSSSGWEPETAGDLRVRRDWRMSRCKGCGEAPSDKGDQPGAASEGPERFVSPRTSELEDSPGAAEPQPPALAAGDNAWPGADRGAVGGAGVSRRSPGTNTGAFDELAGRLTERDFAIIAALAKHKIMTAGMLEALFFPSAHSAAARLLTLSEMGVLARWRSPASRAFRYVLD